MSLARWSRRRAASGLGPLKTQSLYRTVRLPQIATGRLAAHLARWPAHRELGLAFCIEGNGPILQHPFAMAWANARAKAGVPDWATPHRHYLASVLIRSGASVKVVQARLGHSSAKTTLDVYGHLFADEEDRTRAAIDAEFGSRCAPDVHQRGALST
jgi:integrase